MDIYAQLDPRAHTSLQLIAEADDAKKRLEISELDLFDLSDQQIVELRRFQRSEFDVTLGMLERRIDSQASETSKVRQAVRDTLSKLNPKPSPIHKALIQLSNRGVATALATTNFDLLLEDAAQSLGLQTTTSSLGAIPRPGRSREFAGILHIHGALKRDPVDPSDLVLSDQDFGESYLRRRMATDFIHDAARLFNLVLVGYQANDPPMRYLLNAVAADGLRFPDVRERFVFVGSESIDRVEMQDWRSRGITPIWYDSKNSHAALLDTLTRWSQLSAINGEQQVIERTLTSIVNKSVDAATDAERDLFDHLVRRGNSRERNRLTRLASKSKPDLGWLDRIVAILREPRGEERK
ncbi:MAG: SIR2 family protein [Pseudomonadota bacterium]